MRKTETKEKSTGNCYAVIPSPVGKLLLVADNTALTGLYFEGRDHVPTTKNSWELNAQHPILKRAAKELSEYFTGARKRFSVSLRFAGTDFQRKVWDEISRIPYGETITYSELAKRAGAPEAVRAAGTSTGRNPISIIVPCHRVVGKNGRLCGFAGGLNRKEQLLGLETSEPKGKKVST